MCNEFIADELRTTFLPYGEQNYSPKPETYEMPTYEGDINTPYKKIGMIETVEYFEMISALVMLKKYAREAGADAVINVRYVGSGGMAAPVGNMAFWASGVKAVGEAVIFTASPQKENIKKDLLKNGDSTEYQMEPTEKRLYDIKQLYEKGLINDDEYQKKRGQILDKM